MDPIPEDIGSGYPQDYHPIPKTLAEFERNLPIQSFKIDIVQRFSRPGRLLEIGPSFCEALYLAKQAGYECIGIERSDRCCAFARDVLGLSGVIEHNDPLSLLPDLGQFDVVMLWQVFEHLPDPQRTLQAIAAVLRPGGVLITAQPNPKSLQLSVFGRRWVHIDSPRHLHLFSPTALVKAAGKYGLGNANLIYDDAGAKGWNRFGWTYSITPSKSRERPGIGSRIVGRVLSSLLGYFEMGSRATSYTAVLRKGED